ncbi:hypothetical protein LV164_004343 [Aspergillus fumigatus]|nr:hypothetical protein KXV47_006892 [Aspergillus fumigatus]KAJ8207734.1 hypothetical protein LV164_004343 [Aspergillus fumigatus]
MQDNPNKLRSPSLQSSDVPEVSSLSIVANVRQRAGGTVAPCSFAFRPPQLVERRLRPTLIGLEAQNAPKNPVNFCRLGEWICSLAYKGCLVKEVSHSPRRLDICIAFNSALGSSLPSGASSEIVSAFDLDKDHVPLVLLNSVYLAGFAVGPLVFGPLSEYLGRQPVLIGTYIGYTIFTTACALAPTYASLPAFRSLCGIHAAAPKAVLGGLYSDIYDEHGERRNSYGFLHAHENTRAAAQPHYIGLRGAVVMAAGISGRVGDSWRGRNSVSMARIFGRPFAIVVQEPILLFTSLYLALVYDVLYLFFQAYPIVFQGLYGMSVSAGALAFISMIIGSIVTFFIFMCYSSYHNKALAAGQTWATVEEFRRLPLACLGGPAMVVSLFWLGWASFSVVNPIVPMVAGFFFAIGFLFFIAMLNYLTDAYQQNSASAQAAASTIHSITACSLPLATKSMYGNLGIHWANFAGYPVSDESPSDCPITSHISNLIICVKATQTVSALRPLVHRLNSTSNILFLQNGSGMIEEVDAHLFQDPLTRPNYLIGVISHGVTLNSPFNITHTGFSATSIGPVPRDDGRYAAISDLRSNYLLQTLPLPPTLNLKSYPYTEILQVQLEKLAVNAFCNPLCALNDAKNEFLFSVPDTRRAILTEISNVVLALPELKGVQGLEERFSVARLEKTVNDIIAKTANTTCSMVRDLRAGRETAIQFINGSWSRMGKMVGVDTPVNDALVEQIKMRGRENLEMSDQ